MLTINELRNYPTKTKNHKQPRTNSKTSTPYHFLLPFSHIIPYTFGRQS